METTEKTHKIIYWCKNAKVHEGERHANIHLLVDSTENTLGAFEEMADEFRKTFPQAANEHMWIGRAEGSSRFNGFMVITWSASIPLGEYPGWIQTKDKFGYRW